MNRPHATAITLAQLPSVSYDLSVEAPGFSKLSQGIRIYARARRVSKGAERGASKESITARLPHHAQDRERGAKHDHSQELLDELPVNFGARGNIGSANIRNPVHFFTLVGWEHFRVQSIIEWRSLDTIYPGGGSGLKQLTP